MAEPWRLGVAVLAAGASKRFGDTDKLTAHFRGKMLGEHVVGSIPLDRVALEGAWVITSRADHPCQEAWRRAGFGVLVNGDAHKGMGTSVARAAMLAEQAKFDALLIALADMPLVPREHFSALVERGAAGSALVASNCGGANMPPALIGKQHFSTLADLYGDQGARALLSQAETIHCPPEWLIDIDTPEDLQKYGQS